MPFGAFPDEPMHMSSSAYYRTHWLPPGVSELLVPYLDDMWGASYLQSWPPQAIYFVWGRLSLLFGVDEANLWIFIRVFNVAVWITLATLAFIHRHRLPLIFLVGATPQAWYVFSYAASDAFTATIAGLFLWQVCSRDGSARLFLTERTAVARGIVPAATLAFFVLSKSTNMFALLLASLRAIAVWWRTKYVRQLVVACAIVLALALPFLVADSVRSGPNRDEKMRAYTEEHAAAPFKPSGHHLETVYYGLALKERGVSWQALFKEPWRWADFTAMSFLGVYGPMSIFVPRWIYVVQLVCWGALLFLIGRAAFADETSARVFAIATLVTIAALVGASFWHSWSYDFQPQGRYLLSIIALVGGVWLDVEARTARWARVPLAVLLVVNLCSLGYGAATLLGLRG